MIYSIQRRPVCRQLSLEASHSYRESRHNYFLLIAAAFRSVDWNFSPWLALAQGGDKETEALETRH